MFNTTIPISRLLAGTLSFFWIIQLFMIQSDQNAIDFISVMLRYKDLSIFFAFVFIILSYPLGIVVSYISYHITDRVLYRLFVFSKEGYDSLAHKERIEILFMNSTDRLNGFLKEKTQELSILGTSAFNFLLISFIMPFSQISLIYLFFTLMITLIFFFMLIWKYKSWYRIVEKNINLVKKDYAKKN